MNSIKHSLKKALDINALSLEEQEEIIVRVGGLIYQNVLTRSLEIISEEKQDEFETILDANQDPEKIFKFLKENVPNFEEIIEEEAEKFKNKSSSIMDHIGS